MATSIPNMVQKTYYANGVLLDIQASGEKIQMTIGSVEADGRIPRRTEIRLSSLQELKELAGLLQPHLETTAIEFFETHIDGNKLGGWAQFEGFSKSCKVIKQVISSHENLVSSTLQNPTNPAYRQQLVAVAKLKELISTECDKLVCSIIESEERAVGLFTQQLGNLPGPSGPHDFALLVRYCELIMQKNLRLSIQGKASDMATTGPTWSFLAYAASKLEQTVPQDWEFCVTPTQKLVRLLPTLAKLERQLVSSAQLTIRDLVSDPSDPKETGDEPLVRILKELEDVANIYCFGLGSYAN